MPRYRKFGFSSIYREDSTGTTILWMFGIPVWEQNFLHFKSVKGRIY